ncbi:MAG: response regulator [Myxococcota bacterium]
MSPSSTTLAAQRPAKVLVADDSEVERANARQALSAAGYEVVEAHDGQQALEVFARERPDLVLLDVVMPRLTGLEACRILKAKTPRSTYLPVIMVSTRNSVNARVEGLRTGADDYLGKPYDVEELQARVEALLRARRVLNDAERPVGAPSRVPDASAAVPTPVDPEANDRAVRRRLEEEFDRADRYSDPLTCLRVEIDQYDEVLAAQGADTVVRAVQAMREVIESSVRKIDLVFRADERGFMLVLPNTHFPGALAVAERIARDAKHVRRSAALPDDVTVSVGVSFFPNKDTHSLKDLLDLVDAALSRARGEGGGHVCLYQHQGYLYRPEG